MLRYILIRLGILVLALSMCSCVTARPRTIARTQVIINVARLRDVAAPGQMRPMCAGPCEHMPPCAAFMPHGAGQFSGCSAL